MPYTWVNPERFMQCDGVVVYHSYKDNFSNGIQTFWYTTDIHEDSEYAFDVRDLPGYDATKDIGDRKHHRDVISAAVSQGLIKTPDEKNGKGNNQPTEGGSHWDEDPDYPVEEWKCEVDNDDTRQSYKEWVQSKKEGANT